MKTFRNEKGQSRVLQKGLTLIELMLAATLALILLLGLSELYVTLKRNFELQQTEARIQESGRFITTILSQRIKTAGLANCKTSTDPVIMPAVTGYDSENLPVSLQGQVKQGTDVLVITSCMDNTDNSGDLNLQEVAYFVSDTKRVNSQGQKIYALYQKPLTGDRLELVPGVSQLIIEYGVADNSKKNVDRYLSQNEVTDWSQVMSIKMDLVIDSIEPIVNQPHPYYFQQQWITPDDHLLYQPWSVYASLREFQS